MCLLCLLSRSHLAALALDITIAREQKCGPNPRHQVVLMLHMITCGQEAIVLILRARKQGAPC